MKSVTLSLVLLIAAAGALAQPAGFEKVLFPVVVLPTAPVFGVLGSRWVTDVSVLNTGNVPVRLAGRYSCFFCQTEQPLQPQVSYTIVPLPPPLNFGGAFLFVEHATASQLRFGLRVRDTSRESDGFGSELPVVRESEFRDDGVSLLGIPNQPSLRLTLRMYALNAAGGQIRVRIYEQRAGLIVHLFDPMPTDALVSERVYGLVNAYSPDIADNYPPYAQVSDLPMPSTPLARIDIVPITPGLRIWAFASATNNTTQQVTVISPH